MKPNDETKWNDALFREELNAHYVKNYDKLVDLVYRTTGNQDDAEDIVQTVFQRLIARPDFQKGFRKNPAGYLYRATINEALNIIEARKRIKREDEDVSDLELAEPQLSPDREAEIVRVRAVLARMNSKWAELLNLHYLDGLSCIQIGRLWGKSPPAIFMQLSRARVQFKKQYRIQERRDETQKARHERVNREGYAETSEA
jgi:RNA polymerase sigma factor (sigma-70 family)